MTITNKIAFVGQPGQLLYKQVPIPTAQDDSIVIKNHLAGVNYADIFHLAGTVNLTGSDILGLER
jgi:NADPH2:quinone reductase